MSPSVKAILPLLVAVVLSSSSVAANKEHLRQEDDVREVVFRHLLSNNLWARRGVRFDGYYLALGYKRIQRGSPDPQDLLNGQLIDPSDEFMKRFGSNATVHKGSSSRYEAFKGVLNRRTGKPGLLLAVTTVVWLSDTEVKVEAAYDRANLASAGFTYIVKKENGTWTVAEQKMDWISQDVRVQNICC